ncbi:MAG: hypothetical protein L0Y61_07680, partial [Epsilonproteobacteria bacterium]|nr:hypothetical protein [Campylobacterota bacterium]
KPSKLAIWPQQLQKAMILNHGQTDTGFFILLKYILSGRNKYVEIHEEFKSMQLDKELDRTLRGSILFETEAGYESPLYVDGNDENMTIGYKPFLEDTLKEMYEDDPTFSYLEEGSALFRIYAQQIAQGYEQMAGMAAHQSGYVGKLFRAKENKYINQYNFYIVPKKNKIIVFEIVFQDVSASIEPQIKEIYYDLAVKYGDEFVTVQIGSKKQHIKTSYTYQFSDFENELKYMKELCNEIYSTTRRWAEKPNEDG